MTDRYTSRPALAEEDHGQSSQRPGADPLAELARLIGQADPFTNFGRDAAGAATKHRDDHGDTLAEEEDVRPTTPSWMQRAAQTVTAAPARRDTSFQDHDHAHDDPELPSAAAPGVPGMSRRDPHVAATGADASRYDDALYGDAGHHDGQSPDAFYPASLDDYQDDQEAGPAPKRRKGLVTVAAVMALAVLGTAGAFGYRSYVGSPRSGEPPVIRAETGPNKVVPTQTADASGKVTDRIGSGGGEKLVSREEQPVDVAKAGARVVFPPPNQALTPPQPAGPPRAAASAPLAANASAPAAGDEPRRVRTLSIKPEQAEPVPAPKPVRTTGPAAAPVPVAAAPAGSSPMSLSPQSPAPTRTASVAPAGAQPPAGGGGFVVQISSQRSESDARASYSALQGKFPTVLGSRAPLIKRADLGDKGVYYRAMVGPFGNSDDATQFCGNLKTAGGQCVVQRN